MTLDNCVSTSVLQTESALTLECKTATGVTKSVPLPDPKGLSAACVAPFRRREEAAGATVR